MLSRRNFVRSSGLTTLAITSGFESAKQLIDSPVVIEKGPDVKKITVFAGSGSFYRFIGPNSYDEKPKGIYGHTRRTVLVELSDGTIGMGTVGYRQFNRDVLGMLRPLLGQDVFSFYRWRDDKIVGVSTNYEKFLLDSAYSWVESALLDAIGKVRQLPVYKLFGDSIKDGIDPYDGTLYFADIVYPHKKGTDVIRQIGQRIKRDGYRAIKLKVGRCDKWMPGEAGVERDIEAFIALREAVGTNFTLMTDANNGYKNKVEWALRFLKACAPYKMYFIEELIPDDTSTYIQLRDALHAENLHIPIADGENIWMEDMMEVFYGYCESGVYSYIQPDIPTCGFSNILRIAKMADKYPHVRLIPHVWQSQMGLLMSTHIAKIQKNIPFVEDSRYDEHVMVAPDYKFADGQWFVPETPGWGVYLAPGYEEYIVESAIELS